MFKTVARKTVSDIHISQTGLGCFCERCEKSKRSLTLLLQKLKVAGQKVNGGGGVDEMSMGSTAASQHIVAAHTVCLVIFAV